MRVPQSAQLYREAVRYLDRKRARSSLNCSARTEDIRIL
jgi:hypothetical protein